MNNIRKRYDLLSKVYDILDLGGVSKKKKLAVDFLNVKANSIVMDLGTGTGAIVPHVASKLGNGKIICVDFSEKMVKVANKRFKRKGVSKKAKAVVADVTKLPFPKNYFNSIIATYSFTSFSDPVKALRECRRVLKKGGTISILDTGKVSNKDLSYRFLRKIMLAIGYTDISVDVPDIVNKNGFKITKRIYFPRTLTYIIVAKK